MEHNSTSHIWMMVLAFGAALLLIFVLPLIGLSKNWSVGIAIVFMLGLHLWMMKGHSDHGNHEKHKGGSK